MAALCITGAVITVEIAINERRALKSKVAKDWQSASELMILLVALGRSKLFSF